MRVAFLYRGPLERARLSLMLQGVSRAFGPVKFRWLVPWGPAVASALGKAAYAEFLSSNAGAIEDDRQLDGRTASFRRTRRTLTNELGLPDVVVCFGFTSLLYGRALNPNRLAWVVNGLPEERLIHRDTLRAAAMTRVLWRSVRMGRRPHLTVVVSERMRSLLTERLGPMPFLVIPSCTDVALFRPPASTSRRFHTYLGTGAPWQGLDLLGSVWSELAKRDPSVAFRVVSKDARTRVLGQAVPQDRVEFVAGSRPEEVAKFLWQAEAGFLLRRPNVVNSLAAPAKFAEYVASGTPVIATDTGWDLASFVRETRCGLVLTPTDPPEVMATSYLTFRDRGGLLDAQRACLEAAPRLDRSIHADRLARALRDLAPSGAEAA